MEALNETTSDDLRRRPRPSAPIWPRQTALSVLEVAPTSAQGAIARLPDTSLPGGTGMPT
jgi:hypothetical protein